MRLKKALTLIKKHCDVHNCCVGVCPLAFPEGRGSGCMIAIDEIDSWNVKKINKKVKLMKTKMEKVKK